MVVEAILFGCGYAALGVRGQGCVVFPNCVHRCNHTGTRLRFCKSSGPISGTKLQPLAPCCLSKASPRSQTSHFVEFPRRIYTHVLNRGDPEKPREHLVKNQSEH